MGKIPQSQPKKTLSQKEQSRSKKQRGLIRFLISDASFPKRLPFWMFILPIIAFAAVEAFAQLSCYDVWWHIKTGEWIWRHHQFPHTDPFSFTAAGQPWIAHEWLFGLSIFQVFRHLGITGLVVFQSIFAAGLLALAAWVARVKGATAASTMFVLAIAYSMCRTRFYPRPELVSLCLAVAFLLVYEKGRRKSWLLLFAPALQLLWVNFHGGTALLGWGLAGAFLLDQAWELQRNGMRWHHIFKRKEFIGHLAALAAVILVSFANPYALEALTYGTLRAKSPFKIDEFESLAESLQTGLNMANIFFFAFVLLMACLYFLRRRDIRISEWLLSAVLLILTVTFFRFRPLLAFLLAPTVAWQLSRFTLVRRLRWWIPALISVIPLVCIVVSNSQSYAYRFGPGVHPTVLPVEAAEFIKQSRLSGRMFNVYEFGGYLIWRLNPEIKVFIDGREDVYVAAGIADDYIDADSYPRRWRNLADKYAIDFAVIKYPTTPPPSPDLSVERLAFARSDWALVYFDDLAIIYVRRNGKNDRIIQECEIKTVQPLQLSVYLDNIVRDPDRTGAFVQEMNANLRRHPESFRAHSLLGIFAMKRGPRFWEQGIEEFKRTIALNPEFAPAYSNLHSLYLALGRVREAEDILKKAPAGKRPRP